MADIMDKIRSITQIEAELSSPPSEYRPFVRWWWFGNAVTPSEIERHLSEIHNAGFGGVEIQPIYSAQDGHPLLNTPDIPWLSPKWVEMVELTCKEAKKYGLQVDMTFGNGWPFGGPYITRETASTRLTGCSMPLEPNNTEIDITDFIEDVNKIVAVLAINVKSVDPLRDTVNLLPFLKGDNKIYWTVPDGEWHFYLFHQSPTEQKVKRATPGGQGLVLDHLNRAAFDLHASKIDQALSSRLGIEFGQYFGAFFCDSWEVYGENWTPSLMSEFKRRKGYDPSPFFPAMIQKVFSSRDNAFFNSPPVTYPSDVINQVIYDYRKVHGDLILEQFFSPFVEYCHKRGVKCRVQPYVAPTDLIKAYGLLDILEIEGFGRKGIGTNYYGEIDPRMASSSAHIYRKSWVSCESFTWLGEHFSVSLEQIKHEADQIILHGINRIIYHGCPYSPAEAGIPGWVFYAAIQVNPQNPWWPYIQYLNRYITQNAFLAHQGKNVADFAVYRPLHDEWMGKTKHLIRLRDALRNFGWLNEFDYVNDDRLVQDAEAISDSKTHTLRIGDGEYFALIIWETDYMPFSTTKRLEELLNHGARIIFIHNFPKSAPGLRAENESECIEVGRIFNNIENLSKDTSSKCVLIPEFIALKTYLTKIGFIPDITIDPINDALRYLHRRVSDCDLYFIVNGSEKDLSVSITFRAMGKIKIWKPIENRYYDLLDSLVEISEFGLKTPLTFQAYESYWIFISDNLQSAGNPLIAAPTPILIRNLPSNWDITFERPSNPFPLEPAWSRTFSQVHLFDWAKDPVVFNFTGTAIYRIPFEITESELKMCTIQLALGEVHEIADIFVNEIHVAVLWQGNRICEITAALKSGINELQIKVTNLLLNRILDYEQNNIKWRPDYYFVNIDYKPFNPKEMQPLPSGLFGPVQIKLYERK